MSYMISYVGLVYHIWYHMWYILYHIWYNRLIWYHNISCDITIWYHIWYHVWYGFTHSLGHVILRFFHDILYDIMLFWRYHMTQRMYKTISHMITYVISCNFAWYHHYVISHNCDVIEIIWCHKWCDLGGGGLVQLVARTMVLHLHWPAPPALMPRLDW